MGQLLIDLGDRSDGQLIRSTDWNQLVVAVDNLETLLAERVDAIENKLDDLSSNQIDLGDRVAKSEGRLDSLEENVQELQTDMAIWTGEYLKMTLNTTRLTYPIGEMAVLEANVTDVRGNPLDLTDINNRPWVDFVANWGLLKPDPAFPSRGGVGERSISVQVNENGIARINVRAEHGEGVPEEEEKQVSTALKTLVPAMNKSLSRVIMETATPVEAFENKAFRLLRTEYDREAETSLRRYVDTAFLKYSPQIQRRIHINPNLGWKDHRTTVVAFVKADNNPTTADHCLATSSLTVSFRDWVSPFVELDYLPNISTEVGNIRNILAAAVEPSLPKTVDNFKLQIKNFSRGRGWLGRLRNLRAVNTALDELQVPNAPAHLPIVTRSLRDAVSLQRTLDSIQLTTADPDREVALDAFTNSQVRADEDTAVIREQVNQVGQDIQSFSDEFEEIRKIQVDVQKFDVRSQLTRLRDDFTTAQKEIGDLSNSVVKLETLELRELKTKVGDLNTGFAALDGNFNAINTTVTRLDEKTGTFETEASNLTSRQKNLETQVKALEILEVNPGEVSTGINQIGSMLTRLSVLENRNPV